MADSAVLYVTYGDDLADQLRSRAPGADLLVVREALRDGPLVPPPADGLDAFVVVRARHLARTHGADESAARTELQSAWERLAAYTGEVVLVVDAEPCVDCAAFAACALDVLHRAGRGVAGRDQGVRVSRGGDPAGSVALRAADIAAGAGAWRLLVAGDDAGLTLAATDLEGTGGMAGIPELPALLVRRARGDVPLDEVHPR
jgi:hypothetical protein